MDDYGLLEANRDAAISEAHQIAASLRRSAARIDGLTDKAAASSDESELIGALAAGAVNEATGTVGNLGLGRLAKASADWAQAYGTRGGR